MFVRGPLPGKALMPNRDNSGINCPQGYPGSLFAVVIYTILESKGSESFRKQSSQEHPLIPTRERVDRSKD